MAYSPSEKYPGAVDSDPNYQGGKFRDNNPSTTNNGSPLKAIDRNELLARDEAIMNDAGFEYSGVADTPQDSQLFKAYKASLGNGANLLSNHNFLIQTPDDSQPLPGATPTSYPPGYQIFSGVFANETTGITNLTYIDGRVSFSGGDLYFSVPNTGAIARLTAAQLTASVADFDGKPRTRGVSFALVGDEYRVTVDVDALEDVSAALTPLGSVKFEQGSVATGHAIRTADSSSVTYTDPLSPPYLQTVSDIVNGIPVSVLRFIDPSNHQRIINGVDVGDLSAEIQDADNAISKGGSINFTRGLYRFSGVNKSQYTSWRGDTNNNYTNSNGPSLTLGTKFSPFSDGVMVTTENDGTGDPEYSAQVDWFKDFAVYGMFDMSGFDNTHFFKQVGDRISGAGFKRLDIKQIYGGLDFESMSFLNFDEVFITGKFCLNTNNLSDSVFNRIEVGTGLPSDASYLAKLTGGYGWRCIGVPGQTNGNNRIDNARIQLNAPGGAYSALFQNMLSTRLMSPIIDQNRTNGIQFKDCIDTEIYAPQGFNNAEDASTPKWTIDAQGCEEFKISGGRIFNKPLANLNNDPGDGVRFDNGCSNVSLSDLSLDDTLVTKVSGISNLDFISNCPGINDTLEIPPSSGWSNSSGSPLSIKREARLLRLTGTISGGVLTNGTQIGVINQAAYRPKIDVFSNDVYITGQTKPNAVKVSTTGEISIVGGDWESNSFVSFNINIDLR